MFHINIIENRKFNCACNNRGMMTIEACIIIPMIIFISLLLIWTGILLYNKSAVNFALAAGLDAGEENAEADNEELCTIMKLKTEELLKDRLILVKDPGIEAVTEYGRLNLKLDAFMQAPPVPLTADAGLSELWDTGGEKYRLRIRKSQFIRTVKRADELIEEKRKVSEGEDN